MTKHVKDWRRALRLRLLGLAVTCLGCAVEAPGDPPAIQRLVDLVASADIRSPLLEAGAVGSDSLDPVARRELWSWPLTTAGSAGWDRQRRCRGTRVINCQGSFSLEVSLPVRGSSFYAAEVEATVSPAGCATMTLSDSVERLDLFPLNDSSTERASTYGFLAASPASEQFQVQIVPRAEGCTVSIHRARLDALELSPNSVMSLARSLAPMAGDGIAQAGYLLPTVRAGRSALQSRGSSFDYREALLTPTPSDLSFALEIPANARLQLAYSLHRFARLGQRADFEVVLTGPDGADETLLEETLTLDDLNWLWHEVTLDLAPWGGRRVRLSLRTTSPQDGPVLAVWGSPRVVVARQDGDPPNVLLLAVDTLRADRLSAYSETAPATPNIDALAGEGVLFEQAVSHSNWTLPSFSSVFTGQTVHRHGVIHHSSALRPEARTMAEALRASGWLTQAILFKPALGRGRNLEQGFESYFNVPLAQSRATHSLDKFDQWLPDYKDTRFFMFLHFDDPHQPFAQPRRYVSDRSAELLASYGLDLPLQIERIFEQCDDCRQEDGPKESFRELAQRLYDDEVRYIDKALGELFDRLKAEGLWDSTLIVFLSDHGETLWRSWGQFDRFGHRGLGLQDHLLHVPLIIKPPRAKGLPAGRRVSTQVRLIDVLPTLLELAGVEDDGPGIEGVSLVPLMTRSGPEARQALPAVSRGTASESLRTDRWKYMRIFPSRTRKEAEFLFDLAADAEEARDVSAEYLGVLATLRIELASYVLAEQPGSTFLLVGGQAVVEPSLIEVTGLSRCPAGSVAPYGLQLKGCSEGVARFVGRALGDIAVLAQVDVADGDPIGVTIETPAGTRVVRGVTAQPLEPGLLARLLEQRAPFAALLRVPGTAHASQDVTEADIEELRALKALGYID